MPPRREVQIVPGTRVHLTSFRVQRTVEATIDAALGVGGTAIVCSGQLADGTHIVLKTPRYEDGLDTGFEVERELFKKFAHRNIVHCVGSGQLATGHPVLAFRRAYENPLLLMTKGTVDEGMRRDKKALYPSLPLDTAIDLGYELLNALEYVERLGYVHHDVKLANLLIDIAPKERPLEGNEVFGRVVRRDYRGVLIDFGATRSREYLEAYSRGEAPPGLAPQVTPFYAPPEALVEARRADGQLGVLFDPSIDVYAASLVLYAMITGHPPYSHLRSPPDPRDLESVIAVKSAERRGEIEVVSADVIGRVVFEETRFIGGDRHAWDQAFHRFLQQRLDKDPARRGSAQQMKRDFELLMQIKTARDDQGPREGGSRVFLPFTQELVKVGASGEHPLLRAARLYGTGVKGAGEVAESKIVREPRGTSRFKDQLGWLGDDAAPATASGTRPAPADPRASGPRKAPPERGPSERVPVQAPRGERTPPPPDRPAPRPAPAQRPPERPGPPGAPRRPEFNQTMMATTQVGGELSRGPAGPDPGQRPPPPAAKANAPHCIVSAVLDEPLLIPRDRRLVVGRESNADIRIKSDLVSRRHAEIFWTGGCFAVVDQGSVNGTLVNGVRISGSCALHPDDRIGVAGFDMIVKVLDRGQTVETTTEGGGTTRLLQPEAAKELLRDALSGDLGQLKLRDVIELLEWKKHSGTLTITPAQGTPGRLYFKAGVIIHAETKSGKKGLEAAAQVLAVTGGRFGFAPGKPRTPVSITCGNEALWGQAGAPGG